MIQSEKSRKNKGGIRLKFTSSQTALALLFLSPTLIFLILLFFYPVLTTIRLSFTEFSNFKEEQKFVGLNNYLNMITEAPLIGRWLLNTSILSFFVVLVDTLLALLVASLLNQKFRGSSLVKGLTVLPWAVPGIVAAYLFRFMFNPMMGLVNSFLTSIGVLQGYIVWFGVPWLTIVVLVIAYVWKGSPFYVIMYLAAIQTVPENILDAAKIDGAGTWQKFRHIIWPWISPIVNITILLNTFATFNYFDMIWILTQGAEGAGSPSNTMHTLPTAIYKYAFEYRMFGTASAFAVTDFMLLLGFGLMFMWIRRVRL